ncbi:hypothetical protein [Streptomyces sp. NPDC101455]|uniref:hypothetical protein n=1 Tax=Streptomyces sp. NPDC101455 TaxID=3366142 RepID=UPI0038051BBE
MHALLSMEQSHAVRTTRTQVLAAVAAWSDVVENWGRESRDDQWRVMRARVWAERARRAHQRRLTEAFTFAEKAREACAIASTMQPDDPVPWVVRLSLSPMDSPDPRERLPENRTLYSEEAMPPGPWGLLHEVQKRDPFNREAWHHVLAAFTAYRADTGSFARWASDIAPPWAAARVLPLFVHMQIYRQMKEVGRDTRLYWEDEGVTYHTNRAAMTWFPAADTATRSPRDLNFLVQALHYGGYDTTVVAPVFEAIGRCVTPDPWEDIVRAPRHWSDEFLQARFMHLPELPHSPSHLVGRG